MMVVNASYDEGLFYEEIVTDLCENTIYNFSVDVINLHINNNLILPNLTFLIDDFAAYGTGDVDDDGNWATHTFTFKTDPGQTSVKLALRNNAPGGNGNDLALDNIAFQACGPEALILPQTIANICEDGNAINLDATIIGDQFETPAIQWQQSFDEGITWVDIPGAINETFVFDNLISGTYYYRYLLANQAANLQNAKCHIISNNKVIQVLPKFSEIQDSICQGLSVEFGTETYNQTGSYLDTLTNFLGCDSIVTLNLEIIDSPAITADFETINPLCSSTDGIIKLVEVYSDNGPFSFFIEGVGAPNSDTSFILPAGSYQYFITDRFGCQGNFTLELYPGEEMEVTLGDDLVVILGESVNIIATTNLPANTYIWSPVNLLNCINCDRQNFVPLQDMWVTIQSESQNGCSDTDSLYIEVREQRDIFFPNVFTPNGDNINDEYIFSAYGASIALINEFGIYDRWGNKVFEAINFSPNDPTISWNGNFNGRPVSSGVYSYHAEIAYIDGQLKQYSGSITVMR